MQRFLPKLFLAALAPTAAAQIGPTEFVDDFVTVPASVITTIGELLPEASNTGATFHSPDYDPNLVVTEACTVGVTYVSELVGYEDTLGYFTYTEDPFTIVDRQLVFPRLSTEDLSPGDTVTLRDVAGVERTFEAGERIGFFLVAHGFKGEGKVKKWNASKAVIPYTTPALNNSVSGYRGVFTTVDAINPEQAYSQPEQARHVAALAMDPIAGFHDDEPFVLLGFESLNRVSGSDGDFNDAVFVAKSSPASALDVSGMAVGVVGDPDSDGVFGTADAFPNDPDRALVTRFPTFGWNGLGLEDLYPESGDGDYNDTVVVYRFELASDASSRVRDVMGTFHVLARGGSRDHRLGVHIPGLAEDATGTVRVERFFSDDEGTHILEEDAALADVILGGRRFETMLPSTSFALPALPGSVFVNTEDSVIERMGASSRLLVTFDTPHDALDLGPPPFDIYFRINDGHGFDVDVHLAGVDAFEDRREDLPEEIGSEAFIDDNGYPWLLEVPYTWRFPLEVHDIESAFPRFFKWASSHGTQRADWYDTYVPSRVGLSAPSYLEARDWSVALPAP